ncbi:MAG: fumarylacetoacetate hydrolase family protein [Actinomycetales bacterium]
MRIARVSVDDEPVYGVVEGDGGDAVVAVVAGDPLFQQITFTGQRIPLADARLLAPVIPRSKVVCIGKNYHDHAREMGGEAPGEPLFFLKPNTSVIGPGDAIVYPRQTQELHYEGELALVIGRICKDVPRERWQDVVFGYTVANDVTARDLQRSDGQWTRSKGFDTFCPVGPWIETQLDASDLALTTELNGDVKQSGRTSELVHDLGTLIAHVTAVMTLLPGDLLLTGTPAGVGPMEPGDTVSVTVERIGTLSNPVVSRG